MAVSSIGDTYFTNYSTEANDAVSQKMTSQIQDAAGIDLACHLHSHRHHLTSELTCIRLVAIDPPSTQGASYGAEARASHRRRESAVHRPQGQEDHRDDLQAQEG